MKRSLRRFQQAVRLQSQSNETYAIGTIVRPLFYQHAPVLDRHCPGVVDTCDPAPDVSQRELSGPFGGICASTHSARGSWPEADPPTHLQHVALHTCRTNR